MKRFPLLISLAATVVWQLPVVGPFTARPGPRSSRLVMSIRVVPPHNPTLGQLGGTCMWAPGAPVH